MARFVAVVRHARFIYSPYTAYEMQAFAQVLADSIRTRIQNGQNMFDQPAAPLKPSTVARKSQDPCNVGVVGPRNWTWTGFTLRCLKVLSANENRAVIGFLDELHPYRVKKLDYRDKWGRLHAAGKQLTASQIAAINNRIEHQWGVSERDRQALEAVLRGYRPLVTVAEMNQAGFFKGLRAVGFANYLSGIAKAA
jgi:hypothetical protein